MFNYRSGLIVIALLCFVTMATWATAARTMSVQMKKSELRASPSGLGSVVATVKLGDRLTVLGTKGTWTRVSTAKGTTGWIPTSSLTRKKIKIKSGNTDARVAASSDEMSLATKGFTSQVESDFKNQNKEIDFKWVDKMIAMKVTTGEMKAFLKKGNVKAEDGGAP